MDKELINIIRELQAQDMRHFDEFYDRCYLVMYKMALKRCQNPTDAKDIVQDAFVEVLHSIHNLKYPEAFYLWLSRIVSSKCTRLFRSNRDTFLDDEQILKIPNIFEKDVQFLPKESTDNDCERAIIHKFVNELSICQQEVITLIYFEQKSLKEVSNELRIPVGTVKSRLHQARRMLYKKISLYEQREQRNLQFHTSSFASAGLMLYAKQFGTYLCNFINVQKNTIASALLNTTVAVTTVSTIVISAYASTSIYDQINETNREPSVQVSSHIKQDFPKFQAEYLGKIYNTQKEAYFEVIKWAKSESPDVTKIKPLYDALKKENGAYYLSLCEMDISTYFE